jgi:hypothetical protein
MEGLQPILHNQFQFNQINRFLDHLVIRKCVYYASDVLNAEQDQWKEVEHAVQRTLEVFRTLAVSADEHFYTVYRVGPGLVYKDWRLSELACLYLMVDGDPTDLKSLAHQQTALIDQMLEHIHIHPMHMRPNQPFVAR